MKRFAKGVSGAVALTLMASAAWAGGMGGGSGGQNSVRWETIVGLIQPGNSVYGIAGGGQPWSTLGGNAYVDLTNNIVEFNVRGLVLAGGNAVGTTGPIAAVTGTLACASGVEFDTGPVTLDAQGDAFFDGSFTSTPTGCTQTNAAFLIRISSSAATNGLWIANGAVRLP
jgi:hypothetical protein